MADEPLLPPDDMEELFRLFAQHGLSAADLARVLRYTANCMLLLIIGGLTEDGWFEVGTDVR